MSGDRETWRPVPGYEGLYEVSDQGRVLSWKPWRGNPGPRFLTPMVGANGYPHVRLSNDRVRNRRHYIHHLVAFAFIGPRPEGMEVCHYDGVRLNASLSNLRYGTHSENMYDRSVHVVKDNPQRLPYCQKGIHVLSEENIYRRPDTGRRRCRPCALASNRAWKAAAA